MGELKDKTKGTFHEVKGKVTNDRSEELKGKAEKTWGNIQGKVNDVKDNLATDNETETRRSYSGDGYMTQDDAGAQDDSVGTLGHRS